MAVNNNSWNCCMEYLEKLEEAREAEKRESPKASERWKGKEVGTVWKFRKNVDSTAAIVGEMLER